MEKVNLWDEWVEEALGSLNSRRVLRSLWPIDAVPHTAPTAGGDDCRVHRNDRSAVEVHISESAFRGMISHEAAATHPIEEEAQSRKLLLLFSGNDYLGLSSHPTIGRAAAAVALEMGMGPRGSPLICGYTSFHSSLESKLADLKKKQDCLLCPTGFSANMSLMVAIGNLPSLLSNAGNETIAVFSDALNHASIIDGIRLSHQRVFVYRHRDMFHLHTLLSCCCSSDKKVVVTDSLFSMDGDFAPLDELAKLRKLHGFLLVIDDAHGTLVCGDDGGGAAEMFGCADDVDICTGTLSKAVGCQGGFIACSRKWKRLIQSTGRSFIFSTAVPVPVAAAASAAIDVAKREPWRRKELWKRVEDFRVLTGINISSPIVSLVVGSEEKALEASRRLLIDGFHVTAIRPPTVPANSSRLRVTLNAAHTREDMIKLTSAIARCLNLQDLRARANLLPHHSL